MADPQNYQDPLAPWPTSDASSHQDDSALWELLRDQTLTLQLHGERTSITVERLFQLFQSRLGAPDTESRR